MPVMSHFYLRFTLLYSVYLFEAFFFFHISIFGSFELAVSKSMETNEMRIFFFLKKHDNISVPFLWSFVLFHCLRSIIIIHLFWQFKTFGTLVWVFALDFPWFNFTCMIPFAPAKKKNTHTKPYSIVGTSTIYVRTFPFTYLIFISL